jgi:gas vesicle protein
MRKMGVFVVGALMGGLLAGIIVMLLTPYSGTVLRQRVNDFSQKLVIDVRSAAEQRRKELEEELVRLRASTGGA